MGHNKDNQGEHPLSMPCYGMTEAVRSFSPLVAVPYLQLCTQSEPVIGAHAGQHEALRWDVGHAGEEEDGRVQRAEEGARPREEEVAHAAPRKPRIRT